MSTKLGRLLIVDDEEPLMSALCDGLKERGYEAEGFTSAEAALQALGERDFDVLLTDLMMPEMDGLALLRATLEIDPHLVGILITGYGTVQTAVDAMKVGAFDYILKPFKLNVILPVLTRAMQLRRLHLENVQLRETVAIQALSRAIAFTFDPNTILNKVVDAAAQQSPGGTVSLLVPTPTGDELYVGAVRGAGVEHLLGQRVSMQKGTDGWVARHNEPIVRASSVWVPLLSGGKLQGVLHIEAPGRRRPFTLGEVKALNILVSIAAPALENAGLYARLREAEEKYRSIFEHAIEGIFRLGADGRFEAANPALAAMLGFSRPDEMLGQPGHDALFGSFPRPADPTHDAGLERQWQERDSAEEIECEIDGQEGRRVWVAGTVRAVHDEQGQLLCYEGALRDITERKRAEEALAHERDLLHALMDNIPDAIFFKDTAGHFTRVNRTVAEDLGLGSPEEAVGKSESDLFTPEQMAAIQADEQKLVATGTPLLDSIECLTLANGEQVWASTAKAAIRDQEGRVTGIVGVSRDITRLKQAEHLLAHERDLLHALLDNIPDAIFFKDVGGRFTRVSRVMAEILGLGSPEEAVGKTTADLFTPDQLAEINADEQQVVATGLPLLDKIESRRLANGELTWATTTKAAIKNQEGRVTGIVGASRNITQRKLAEQALRRERDFTARIMQTVPSGIAVVDSTGKIVFANSQAGRVLGRPIEEVLQRSFDAPEWRVTDLAGQPFPDEALTAFLAGALARPVSGARIAVERPGGQRAILSLNGTPLLDEAGQSDGAVFSIEDITEPLRLAREIDSLARFPQENPNPVLRVAADGTVLLANEASRALLDCWDCGVGRPLPTKWRDLAAAVLASGSCRNYEAVCGDRTLSLDFVPLADPGYVNVYGLDITERKRAEAVLASERKLLRTLIDALPDHIYVKDRDGRMLLINEAQARDFGLTSPDEAIGRTDFELGPADLAAQYRATELTVMQLGQPSALEEPYVTPAGEERLMSTVKAPLFDAHGDIIGLVGLSRDITEQKRLEAQLLQAQKMETVGRLAGGVAHDFNNLLTAIGGYASLVKRSLPPDSAAHSDIDVVIQASDRAAGLTRQLLAFSRRQIIEQRVIDLNQLIVDIDKMLRRLIGEDVDLVTVQGQDLGAVKADPGQIEQVLVNLAVNARDAMPTGGELTIETANVTLDANYARTHAEALAGEYVMVAVSDTGAGMTDEVKAQVFEPFFTTKEIGKGTGLGLATVYGIVKQHGGHISVYSEPGQGTTFKVYLPRVQGVVTETNLPTDEATPLPQGTETVLVVEDEPVVREFAVQSLTGLGYVVLEASSGGEALQVARNHAGNIDLLLTDVVMPKMSGKELAIQLKETRPPLAVLYTSGYTDNAIVHHGVLDEGVAFLQKPFTTIALARKVREVLQGA
jgi:two-component system, cell cycle sensor histidine kinase and response regulator CckA